jgi:hypothetical protein
MSSSSVVKPYGYYSHLCLPCWRVITLHNWNTRLRACELCNSLPEIGKISLITQCLSWDLAPRKWSCAVEQVDNTFRCLSLSVCNGTLYSEHDRDLLRIHFSCAGPVGTTVRVRYQNFKWENYEFKQHKLWFNEEYSESWDVIRLCWNGFAPIHLNRRPKIQILSLRAS